ncbi:MAG: AAA family ATPase [Myxococcales bacterium]|nr:AAA family ATPase [Myxococcales bacterium]
MLGELRVSRGEQRQKLPPSKKTRALLGYLALTSRPHRRERLCGLFWDVADDPRGALRWSLSKLRSLVDDEVRERVVADREQVALELDDAEVDLLQVRRALPNEASVEAADLSTLERCAAAFAGELLEGLDLADFDEYQAWCVAEREQTRRLHARILQALCARLGDAPEQALPHARTWSQVDPLDFAARTGLLRVLLATARRDEALQHYESARRMYKELGSPELAQLTRVWHELNPRKPNVTPNVASAAASPPVATAASPSPKPAESLAPKPARTLFGREGDVIEVCAVLDRVKERSGERVLLLTGEPGIGKTRLLDELFDHARRRGGTVMRGAAFEGESGRPYGPLIDGLRDVADTDVETLRDQLAPVVPGLGGVDSREGARERLFSAVAEFVAERAQNAPPALLVLDDVQWLDASTAELLHYLVRTNKKHPLMVALGARGGELDDNPVMTRVLRSLRRDRLLEERTLEPLGLQAVTALVEQQGGDLDPSVILNQSGGNPLFALELARMGAREGDALPESVGDAVRERIERLSPEAADVLRWASLLEEGFFIERLEHLVALDLEAIIDACEELERLSLLRREALMDGRERHRFAHALVRRAVYTDLSEPRRRLMHRRVAQTLRDSDEVDEDVVAELAHHAALGHDHDLAAATCAAAGLRCQRVFAHDQALRLSRRGLRHAERLAGLDAVKRRIDLLEVQLLASRPEDLAVVSNELRQLAEQALREGALEHARRAFHRLSWMNWEGGAWSEARRDSLQVEAISHGSNDQARVASMAEAAHCLILLERDLPEAGAMLMEAEARARPLGIEPISLASARGLLLQHRGDADDALAAFERARVLATTHGDHLREYLALEHQVTTELERGGLSRACALTPQLVDLGNRIREGSEGPFARAIDAIARYGSGEDCLELIDRELEELRMVDAKQRLAYALVHAAQFDIGRADFERALTRAQEALPIAQVLERPSESLLALYLQARAAQALGQRDAAAAARTALAAHPWQGASAFALEKRAELLEEEM